MADRVLFIGWNRAVPGREKQSLESLAKGQEYYFKLKADGRIEDFDVVILDAHGGDLNGFVLIKGTTEQITDVRLSDEFRERLTEANYLIDGIGAVEGSIGEGLTPILTMWAKVIGG